MTPEGPAPSHQQILLRGAGGGQILAPRPLEAALASERSTSRGHACPCSPPSGNHAGTAGAPSAWAPAHRDGHMSTWLGAQRLWKSGLRLGAGPTLTDSPPLQVCPGTFSFGILNVRYYRSGGLRYKGSQLGRQYQA